MMIIMISVRVTEGALKLAGVRVLTGKVEIQAEILNPWRYAAITVTVGCRMTHWHKHDS